MSAEYWFDQEQKTTPAQAALVLCRINPRDFKVAEQYRAEEVVETSLEELAIRDTATGKVTQRKTVPEAYRELRFAFETLQQAEPGASRTMNQWLEIAQRRGLVYHSWVEEWRRAVAQIARESTGGHDARAAVPGDASLRRDKARTARLGIGRPNSREAIAAHVEQRSREMYNADKSLTKRKIATTIAAELQGNGYRGERGQYLSPSGIERLLPTGLTGGRARNGRKSGEK
ncbi:hypothetical protein OKW30_002548 [Paraburkholderia sp. Clong3]|uniref:hypothetical protein n=1 Tax=Paraburkholderia sp. Clong3 TaxID=2991061 RepID=UPI003D1B49D5